MIVKALSGRCGKYPVYIVGGATIRKSVTLQEALKGSANCMADFLDYGIHDTLRVHGGFEQVPKGEIWVATELDEDERRVVVAIAAHRLKGLANGMSSEKAYEESEKFAKDVRRKVFGIVHKLDVYGMLYKRMQDVNAFIVSGKQTRNACSNRFIQGGHGYVYDYVPKDEIWIDDTLDEDEYEGVFTHEYTEMKLMRDKNMSYEKAHELATIEEYKVRGKNA